MSPAILPPPLHSLLICPLSSPRSGTESQKTNHLFLPSLFSFSMFHAHSPFYEYPIFSNASMLSLYSKTLLNTTQTVISVFFILNSGFVVAIYPHFRYNHCNAVICGRRSYPLTELNSVNGITFMRPDFHVNQRIASGDSHRNGSTAGAGSQTKQQTISSMSRRKTNEVPDS